MIKNEQEFQAMLKRIRYFQQQVAQLRQVETNLTNYKTACEWLPGGIGSNESGGARISVVASV